MAAKFEIKQSADEQFMFNLKAANGEVILTSETTAKSVRPSRESPPSRQMPAMTAASNARLPKTTVLTLC
jgi:Domain of unknown function (DUF1508)